MSQNNETYLSSQKRFRRKEYDLKFFWFLLYSAKTNYNFEFKLLIMNNIRIFSNIRNMFFSNFYPWGDVTIFFHECHNRRCYCWRGFYPLNNLWQFSMRTNFFGLPTNVKKLTSDILSSKKIRLNNKRSTYVLITSKLRTNFGCSFEL